MADLKKVVGYERVRRLAMLRIPMTILVLGLNLRIFGEVRMVPEDKKNVKKRNESEDISNVEEADSNLQFFPKCRKLHEEGLSDQKIADEVGVSPSTTSRWRNHRGLPPNQGGLTPEEESKRCDLHKERLNIATGCGREERREKQMMNARYCLCVETTQSGASKTRFMTLIVAENHTTTRLLCKIHRKEGERYG